MIWSVDHEFLEVGVPFRIEYREIQGFYLIAYGTLGILRELFKAAE
jgi:hypothetical protein